MKRNATISLIIGLISTFMAFACAYNVWCDESIAWVIYKFVVIALAVTGGIFALLETTEEKQTKVEYVHPRYNKGDKYGR